VIPIIPRIGNRLSVATPVEAERSAPQPKEQVFNAELP
jgi:hypothetical protein